MRSIDQKKLELAKLRRAQRLKLVHAFDGLKPESRPTPAQQDILTDVVTKVFWIIAGNRSGKSQIGSRIVSWWFAENHPHMSRPTTWGTGPLQILVVGRLGEQMESELWTQKIKPFLAPGSFREVRIGNMLQRVENLQNGNRIIFLSHHDALNAREKVQAFTAQVVWLDEMPDHAGLVTELVMRTLTAGGRLYGTFTPLIRNEEIRKITETDVAGTRKCKLVMLDNPVFAGREAEVEAQVRATCSSEAEFRARMYGDWYYGDTRVCAYDRARNWVPTPPDYNPMTWRHLALCDPSASGLTGLTVWAESPTTGAWYCTKAVYLKGAAAFDLYDSVEFELLGFRVLWRRCDCNPAGFYQESARRRGSWVPYTDKADRKLVTIDKLNEDFLKGRLYLTEASYRLEDELVKISWSDRAADKIINASSYHLFDTARYFNDVKPAFAGPVGPPLDQIQQVRADWKSRIKREAEAKRLKILERTPRWKRPLVRRSVSLAP